MPACHRRSSPLTTTTSSSSASSLNTSSGLGSVAPAPYTATKSSPPGQVVRGGEVTSATCTGAKPAPGASEPQRCTVRRCRCPKGGLQQATCRRSVQVWRCWAACRQCQLALAARPAICGGLPISPSASSHPPPASRPHLQLQSRGIPALHPGELQLERPALRAVWEVKGEGGAGARVEVAVRCQQRLRMGMWQGPPLHGGPGALLSASRATCCLAMREFPGPVQASYAAARPLAWRVSRSETQGPLPAPPAHTVMAGFTRPAKRQNLCEVSCSGLAPTRRALHSITKMRRLPAERPPAALAPARTHLPPPASTPPPPLPRRRCW